jgi:hypothetical protein
MLPEDLVRSPAWFPLRLSANDAVTLVWLDEPAYAAASFLDERILEHRPKQATCPLETVRTAAAALKPPCLYVFHTGHVGSTLISRLIGAHAGFFSVREPKLMRAFVDDPTQSAPAGAPAFPLRLDAVLALFSRTFRPEQRAVLKATSIVNEIAESILGCAERPSAIFMFASPLNYLRGILAGPNSRIEARMLAPSRLRRLVRRLGPGWYSEPRSEGEQVAMNWLCEMTALYQAGARSRAPVLWVDFDVFLGEPAPGLESIVHALGGTSSSGEIETLVSGPIMRRYSKAPEHAYDALLRREVLMSADWEHGGEIRRGMEWLGHSARRHSTVHAVLESAAITSSRSPPAR